MYMSTRGNVNVTSIPISNMSQMGAGNVITRTPFELNVDYETRVMQVTSNGGFSNSTTKTFKFTESDLVQASDAGASATTAAPSSTTTTTTVAVNVFANAVPGVTKTDTTVYRQAPAKVAADSAINVLTAAQNKVMDVETKTPAVCLPNDDELIFIDEGRFIAKVVNAKTRKVLRTLRTTVVGDDISELQVGNEIVTLAPIYFGVMSSKLDAKAMARVKSLKTKISAAGSVLLVGHSGTLNGNSPENIAISSARSTATLKALRSIGATGPFAVSGVGALNPASTGKTDTDQAKNRRVIIVLIP
jgi:outer membrane protein OmpA-like peptidoglycan-associated protein